ncbi:MAG: hypothetical protein IPP88_10165 [Betaproteobacteria bacterium]|nr:hypothetical protein [Betaproteobacteria bacterium]
MQRQHWRAFQGILPLQGAPDGDLTMLGAKDETDPSVAAMNSQNELFQEKQMTLAFSSIFIAALHGYSARLGICMVQRAMH